MSENKGNNQEFGINQIYIKDLSFEALMPLHGLDTEWQPNVAADLNVSHKALDNDYYEVIVAMKVTTTVKDKTVFIVEIQQAGIFKLAGFGENEMGQLVNSFCPNILFPYLRETVSNCVVKGGYPALHLSPVDFDARYMDMRDKQETK